jgi:PhnB protein
MTRRRPLGLTPHLFVQDADAAIRFYVEVFGATEIYRNVLPTGTVLFIEFAVGPNRLLLSEETPSLDALAPPSIGGTPVLLHLEVDDVDGTVDAAVKAGATIEMPVDEMFWGERYGVIRDPFGHRWAVSTKREQLSPDEISHQTPPDIPA